MKLCMNCGGQCAEGSIFCKFCGARLVPDEQPEQAEQPVEAVETNETAGQDAVAAAESGAVMSAVAVQTVEAQGEAAASGGVEPPVSPYVRAGQPAQEQSGGWQTYNTASQPEQPQPQPQQPEQDGFGGYQQTGDQNYQPGFTGIHNRAQEQPQPSAQSPAQSPVKPNDTGWASIVSLIAGIFSVVSILTCIGPIPLGIAAIVFGAIGLGSSKRGMSIAGIVLGIAGIVLDIILILFVIMSAL